MTAPPQLAGQVLGRYQINAVEGAGSTGDIYRATDLQSTEHAAVSLRVFAAPGDGAANAAVAFVEAGERLSRLRHPHLIPVLEHGEIGAMRYVATAHIDGRSLSRLMLDPALRRREQLAQIAEAVCRQIGSALAYLHERGVLHGSVDMHNIVQASDGRFLLTGAAFGCDFSSRDDADARFLLAAIDRAAHDNRGAAFADGGGDLIALGAVLYELVCGMPLSVFADAGYQAPPIPGGMLPRPLQDVIHTLIEPHPNDRYATAREAIAALDGATLPQRRAEAPQPPAGARLPDTPLSRASAPAMPVSKRRRTPVPALAGALIACICGVYAVSRAGAHVPYFPDSDSAGARSGAVTTPPPERQTAEPMLALVATVGDPAVRVTAPAPVAPAETQQPTTLRASATAQPVVAPSVAAMPTLPATKSATAVITRVIENSQPAATIDIDLTAVAIQTPIQRATARSTTAPQPTRTPATVGTATATLAPTLAPTRTPAPPTQAPTLPPPAPTEIPPTATAPPIDGDITLPQPIDLPPPSEP